MTARYGVLWMQVEITFDIVLRTGKFRNERPSSYPHMQTCREYIHGNKTQAGYAWGLLRVMKPRPGEGPSGATSTMSLDAQAGEQQSIRAKGVSLQEWRFCTTPPGPHSSNTPQCHPPKKDAPGGHSGGGCRYHWAVRTFFALSSTFKLQLTRGV